MRTMSWLRRRVVGSGARDKGRMPNDGSARTPDEMRRRALAAARGRLLELRTAGRISERAYDVVEDDLRRMELRAFLGPLYPP